jgi:hypothetical protein
LIGSSEWAEGPLRVGTDLRDVFTLIVSSAGSRHFRVFPCAPRIFDADIPPAIPPAT